MILCLLSKIDEVHYWDLFVKKKKPRKMLLFNWDLQGSKDDLVLTMKPIRHLPLFILCSAINLGYKRRQRHEG